MSKKHLVLPLLFIAIFPGFSVTCQNDLPYWTENERLNIGVSSKYGDVIFYWVDGTSLEAGVVVPDPAVESLIFNFKLVQLGENPEVLVD